MNIIDRIFDLIDRWLTRPTSLPKTLIMAGSALIGTSTGLQYFKEVTVTTPELTATLMFLTDNANFVDAIGALCIFAGIFLALNQSFQLKTSEKERLPEMVERGVNNVPDYNLQLAFKHDWKCSPTPMIIRALFSIKEDPLLAIRSYAEGYALLLFDEENNQFNFKNATLAYLKLVWGTVTYFGCAIIAFILLHSTVTNIPTSDPLITLLMFLMIALLSFVSYVGVTMFWQVASARRLINMTKPTDKTPNEPKAKQNVRRMTRIRSYKYF